MRFRIPRGLPSDYYERSLYDAGFLHVVGMDEAGRGALVGPVVAAAVIFPPYTFIEGVTDSKKLTAARREVLAEKIKAAALAYGYGLVSAADIDRINILQASMRAVEGAFLVAHNALQIRAGYNPDDFIPIDHVPIDRALVDGKDLPALPCRVTTVIRGDESCHLIGAASILAKTKRDALMLELHEKYPQYGIAAHKGYPTQAHREAVAKYGMSEEHRVTFRNFGRRTSS